MVYLMGAHVFVHVGTKTCTSEAGFSTLICVRVCLSLFISEHTQRDTPVFGCYKCFRYTYTSNYNWVALVLYCFLALPVIGDDVTQ